MRLNAGSGDIALSQASTVASAGALTLDSEQGNVSLTESSRATAVTDTTVEAGAGVSLAAGSRLEASNGDLSVTATEGDFTVRESSVLRAGGDFTGRAGAADVIEVILATSATVEGQTTAHYIADRLADREILITRLAHGIPVGGELGYVDGFRNIFFQFVFI